jgi:gliding motility-associated-like protein
VITALQEGSSNWNPAPAVPQSIDVGDEYHKIPSIFTPNHDGINDYWSIPDIEQYGKFQVSIYNRYGQTVYHSDDYKNDWYGTWNSSDLPSASYYYIIKSSTKGTIKGVLNIVR